MEIFDFFQSLEMAERRKLADEISCSVSYINQMVGTRKSLSIELAAAVLNSEFNKSLPQSVQFTDIDYQNYRAHKMQQRRAKAKG